MDSFRLYDFKLNDNEIYTLYLELNHLYNSNNNYVLTISSYLSDINSKQVFSYVTDKIYDKTTNVNITISGIIDNDTYKPSNIMI
jgi:hypothetical protein